MDFITSEVVTKCYISLKYQSRAAFLNLDITLHALLQLSSVPPVIVTATA